MSQADLANRPVKSSVGQPLKRAWGVRGSRRAELHDRRLPRGVGFRPPRVPIPGRARLPPSRARDDLLARCAVPESRKPIEIWLEMKWKKAALERRLQEAGEHHPPPHG